MTEGMARRLLLHRSAWGEVPSEENADTLQRLALEYSVRRLMMYEAELNDWRKRYALRRQDV